LSVRYKVAMAEEELAAEEPAAEEPAAEEPVMEEPAEEEPAEEELAEEELAEEELAEEELAEEAGDPVPRPTHRARFLRFPRHQLVPLSPPLHRSLLPPHRATHHQQFPR
jgi:hypothetical protein